MLVQTRKPGESMVIDDGDRKITVTVLQVRGNQVKLGIAAPRDVPVDREEIRERKDLDKRGQLS